MDDCKNPNENIPHFGSNGTASTETNDEVNGLNDFQNEENNSSKTESKNEYSASNGLATDVDMEEDTSLDRSHQIDTFNPKINCCSTRFNYNIFKGCKWYLPL